jgi:ketosteroid isomerase-like protein
MTHAESRPSTDANAVETLTQLEHRFWRALVDEDIDTALGLLCEPALLVSTHGSVQFDHATYRRMAEQGPMVVKDFQIIDLQVLMPTPDTAVMTYLVVQTLAVRGEPGDIVQRMTDASTWVRQGDRWRCALHTETPLDEPGD